MSNWTHIAGVIRIDHFAYGVRPLLENEAKDIISEGSPIGSEGGLTFIANRTQVIRPSGFDLVWGSVSFVGDLRDFSIEDLPKITKWLEEIPGRLEERQGCIRQGIVLVEIEETEEERIFIFDVEEEAWKEVEYNDKVEISK